MSQVDNIVPLKYDFNILTPALPAKSTGQMMSHSVDHLEHRYELYSPIHSPSISSSFTSEDEHSYPNQRSATMIDSEMADAQSSSLRPQTTTQFGDPNHLNKPPISLSASKSIIEDDLPTTPNESLLASPISPKFFPSSQESEKSDTDQGSKRSLPTTKSILFTKRHLIQPYFSTIPITDVDALKEYLGQVNTSKFGFMSEIMYDSCTIFNPNLISSNKRTPLSYGNASFRSKSSFLDSANHSYFPSNAFDESIKDGRSHSSHILNESDFESFKSPRLASLYSTKSKESSSFSSNVSKRSTSNISNKLKSLKRSMFSSSDDNSSVEPKLKMPSTHSSGATNANPLTGPYKGRFGQNPKCASCNTSKTPYWRDAWHSGTLLCNACGLRFAKFKRRCTQCNYVPRKEDKGGRQCPLCKGSWTQ